MQKFFFVYLFILVYFKVAKILPILDKTKKQKLVFLAVVSTPSAALAEAPAEDIDPVSMLQNFLRL